MKKLCYLILLFLATNASAQYVSQGPEGGSAYSFYREGGRTWLASNTGIFYSDDNGQSWTRQQITPSIYGCDSIVSIASFGSQIYAGSMRNGIFQTNDGGVNWTMVNNNLQKGVPYTDIEIIGPNVLAIRGDSGVLYRSPDNGLSWIRMNFALSNARALWLSVNRNILYVSTDQGLFSSMDNGATYMNINPNVADVGKLVWYADTAYVSTSVGISRSVDDGISFSNIGLAGMPVSNVAVSGRNIVAAVRVGPGRDSLRYSTDGGITFSNVAFPTAAPFGRIHDMTIALSNLLVGTDYGIYRSPATAVSSFRRADSGFNSTLIRNLAVNGFRIYAATFPMGVFYSADSGDSWIHNGDMAHGLESNMLTVDAKNQYVHAGGQNNYYRSSDFGVTWTTGATGLPAGMISSVLTSRVSPDVYAIRNGILYHSSNDGMSFAPVNPGGPGGGSRLIVQADTSIFVISGAGLFKGTAASGFTAAAGISGQVTALVFYNRNYYASTSGNGLFESQDGISWKPVNILTPGTLPAKVNALAVNGMALIAGTDDGLYVTDTAGPWMRDSLSGHMVTSLAVMNRKVYAGTCGGVWALKNIPSEPPTGIAGTGSGSDALRIFPNPAPGDFKAVFTAAHSGEGVLMMRDLLGNTVLRQSVALRAGRNELSVAAGSLQLPAGIYLVQLSNGREVAAQRLIVR